MAVGFYNRQSADNTAPMAEQWDGTSWTLTTVPEPKNTEAYLEGVSCSSSTFCMAVGYYFNSAGAVVALTEHWDGTHWSIAATGAPHTQLWGVSCPSSAACEAAGYRVAGSRASVMAERWNGAQWVVQTPAAPPGGILGAYLGVSCWAATDCIEVGGTGSRKGVPGRGLAVRWNGSVWSEQSTPGLAPPTLSELRSVSCSSARACSAVGQSSQQDSKGTVVQSAVLVERWAGTRWNIQSAPDPARGTPRFSELDGVSCSSTSVCVAVGWFRARRSGIEARLPLIERYS
jgi:hypothetical protein